MNVFPTNWAGNLTYESIGQTTPQSITELSTKIAEAEVAKALGSRHSFNDIADTVGTQFTVASAAEKMDFDHENESVEVAAGAKYGEIAPLLHDNGYGLRNLASLPHISVAGACATATHGSGVLNPCLTTAVQEMDIVVADGSCRKVSPEIDEPTFSAIAVGLGAFGIVTKIRLGLVPTFDVRQWVFLGLPFGPATENFLEVMSSSYSVSYFLNWDQPQIGQVWLKCRADDTGLDLAKQRLLDLGAKATYEPQHPLPGAPTERCTPQLGEPGPWFQRLPHFRLEFTPSAGEELQSEYLLPISMAGQALKALYQSRNHFNHLVQVSEIRTIAADDFLLSPFRHQASVGIHFTWYKKPNEVMKVLPEIESILAPFGARPHWGKLFSMGKSALANLYPKLNDFERIRKDLDPSGKFLNRFLIDKLGLG